MKLAILLCGAVGLLLVGGLAYLALADVPVHKTSISKTIPNERFFNAD